MSPCFSVQAVVHLDSLSQELACRDSTAHTRLTARSQECHRTARSEAMRRWSEIVERGTFASTMEVRATTSRRQAVTNHPSVDGSVRAAGRAVLRPLRGRREVAAAVTRLDLRSRGLAPRRQMATTHLAASQVMRARLLTLMEGCTCFVGSGGTGS